MKGAVEAIQRERAGFVSSQSSAIITVEMSPADGVSALADALATELAERGENAQLIDLAAPVSRLSGGASVFVLFGALSLVRQRRTQALQRYRAQVHQAIETRSARAIILCDVDLDRIRLAPIDGSSLLLDARAVKLSRDIREESRRRLKQAIQGRNPTLPERLIAETGLLSPISEDPTSHSWVKRLIWDGVDALSPSAVNELDRFLKRIETHDRDTDSIGLDSLFRILSSIHALDPQQFNALLPFIRNLCNSSLELPPEARELFVEIGRVERSVRRTAILLSFVGTDAKVSWPVEVGSKRFARQMPDLGKSTLAEAVEVCRHVASQHPAGTRVVAPVLKRVAEEVVPIRNEVLHYRSMRVLSHALETVVAVREELDSTLEALDEQPQSAVEEG